MQQISIQNIIIIVVAIFFLWIVLKFVKGVLKAIIALVLIFTVGISVYNIFFVGKSMSYELNRYKTDISYFTKVTSINKDAYSALQEIKEKKNVEENTKKLVKLEKDAEVLPHSEESKIIHDKYISNFRIISNAAQVCNAANEYKDKINNLGNKDKTLDISLMDLLLKK